MGFDVDAYYPESSCDKADIDAAFAEAESWLKENAGGYDGFISLGSLDCPLSIAFLERAIGLDFNSKKNEIWTGEQVRQWSEAADWPEPADVLEAERWAYWSARKFLEICVKFRLGVTTS